MCLSISLLAPRLVPVQGTASAAGTATRTLCLCQRARGSQLICHLDEPPLSTVLIWQCCCGNGVFLLPGPRSSFPGLQACLFVHKLCFLPPHRCCLQKELQFPVVLDGAVAPLWIPALPADTQLLLSLISSKVWWLLLLAALAVSLFCRGSQRTWFRKEFLAFLRVFIYRFFSL